VRKDVNLKELFEFANFCGDVRSVLGLSELEARTVGIGARKGMQVNVELNVCQVVNGKRCIVRGMRDRSDWRVRSALRNRDGGGHARHSHLVVVGSDQAKFLHILS